MASALDDFLNDCALETRRRSSVTGARPELGAGAAAFTAALDRATPLPCAPTRASVLDELDDTVLPAATLAALYELPWVASPRTDDGGRRVALGLVDRARDLGDVQCGVMVVGAGAVYPLHSHPPQELYLPVTDGGTWRFGGAPAHRRLAPDELPYNRPGDLHEVCAGERPLVALYVLWP